MIVTNGKPNIEADIFCSDLKFVAVYGLKLEERWSVNSSSRSSTGMFLRLTIQLGFDCQK